jgi:hypothetical protein
MLSRHTVRPTGMADARVGWSVKCQWTRRFGEEWARQLPTGKLSLPVRLLQVLRLLMPRTRDHWRRRSMFNSTRSAGAAASAMLKLCCLLFILIGDAP